MMRRGLNDIRITLYIVRKDLLDFWKVRMLVATFTIIPIVWMSMFGFMYPQTGSGNPFSGKISTPYRNIPIAIVDEDNGWLGYDIMYQFKEIAASTGLFTVRDFASFGSAREKIISGEIKGVVVIPAGFTEAFTSNRQATITVTLEDTNPQLASLAYSEISMILKMISDRTSASILAKMASGTDPSFISEPISFERRGLVSTTNTFQFLAPGFMALVLVTGTLQGLAAALTREKEQGTMDGILMAPISRYTIVIGKIIAQTVRGMIQAHMLLLISMLFFGVVIYGSPILMLLVMFLGVTSFSGVGIVLTSFAHEQETAGMMMILLQFPMMFLSGIVFPMEQLPLGLQSIGKMLPLYYAADALRKIIVLGANFAAISSDVAILALYTLITLAIAIPVFQKTMSR